MRGWRIAGTIITLLDILALCVCQYHQKKENPAPEPDDFWDDHDYSGLLEED